jgi:hypothetical protein
MSIEEKQKALEFSYVSDKETGKNTVYDITYDPENDGEVFPIKIQQGSQEMRFTVEFFGEIELFLKQKGISKPVMPLGPTPRTFMPDSKIPIPEIQKKQPGEPVDSLMSFDITGQTPSVSEIAKTEVKTPDKSTTITKDTKVDIPNRPVIRSRVKDGDALSAEKEGAAQRGLGEGGKEKIIKRSNKTD